MKKSTLLVVVLLLAFTPLLNAQVGIGTTNPKALLHIVAPPGTSLEERGIILPKVSELPSANLDGKKGMFLYLDSNDTAEGIYFYNGEKWKKNDNAWRLGGNTVTDADYIGALNNKDLNFKIANNQRLKIGASGDLEYHNANNNKLIGISNNGNYTINNANNNKLIEIKNNGVITLPYTELIDINSNIKSIATKEYVDYEITNASSGSGSGTYNIGDEYMGGIVFHTWDGGTHGLVVSKINLGEFTLGVTGLNTFAKGDALLSGEMNTLLIASKNNNINGATKAIEHKTTVTKNGITKSYGGWYIPSNYELNLFVLAVKNNTGNVGDKIIRDKTNEEYWSSTEVNSNKANTIKLDGSTISYTNSDKHSKRYVRVIKSF